VEPGFTLGSERLGVQKGDLQGPQSASSASRRTVQGRRRSQPFLEDRLRRNLLGVTVDLPDTCGWCGNESVAHVVVADPKARDNFYGVPYRFACVGCERFRGYISQQLQQHLIGLVLTNALQLIVLGARKKEARTKQKTKAA
jgi:hypothetical protein